MTNSDYLLKAAIKKVTEKLNDIVVEKLEEAANIAQDVPEIMKKEFETLKEEIIKEAVRMENEININKNSESSKTNKNAEITEALAEIKDITEHIEQLNKKINNQI